MTNDLMNSSHTILLYQESQDVRSKRYDDFTTTLEALDCNFTAIHFILDVQKMFEVRLKALHAHEMHITYSINDILKYIDEFHDMGMLV